MIIFNHTPCLSQSLHLSTMASCKIIDSIKAKYMGDEDDIILAPCMRIAPSYSDDGKVTFSVNQGRVLVFYSNGIWDMKHPLGGVHRTMWFTTSEWNVDDEEKFDVGNMYNSICIPDFLDIDVYYVIYRNADKAGDVIGDNFVDFHQYVTETLSCMSNVSDMYKSFDLKDGKGKRVVMVGEGDHNTRRAHYEPSSGSTLKWDWDNVKIAKKKMLVGKSKKRSVQKDVHRMMVEIFLPHFKVKIEEEKSNGKRKISEISDEAPDMVKKKYDNESSTIFVSRAFLTVK